MLVRSSTIQQLDKGPDGKKPKSKCRKWRIWATTDQGRKSRVFNGSYMAAQAAQKAFVAELEDAVPCADTFGAYAESWRLWRAESGDLSPNMVAKDARNVRALRRTELDGLRMDELTPEKCRAALLWLKTHPVRGDGELASSTMASFHVTLGCITAQAAGDGRIARDPMDQVKFPKVRNVEREALSPGEIGLLLNRIDAELPLDAHAMAVYLIACLGLRRGEALALLDSDVSGGLVHVHRAVKEADGSVAEPKSSAGVRMLPAPSRLLEKVGEWRAERERLGFADAETLCCNARGDVMRPQNLYKWWCKVSPELGCDGVTLHGLRHSNLSMMARHMSPFDLQRYAGWSSIAPARIYVHDDLDAVSKAVSLAWSGPDRAHIFCTR